MLLLQRVSSYAADVLSLVYCMETFELDLVQHPGKLLPLLMRGAFPVSPFRSPIASGSIAGSIFFLEFSVRLMA